MRAVDLSCGCFVAGKSAGRLCLAVLTSALLVILHSSKAQARGELEYRQAVALYDRRQYKQASELFWKSINNGNTTAGPWLYAANCYYFRGEKVEAIKRYRFILDVFRGTPEAESAAKDLRWIDPDNKCMEKFGVASSAASPPAVNEQTPGQPLASASEMGKNPQSVTPPPQTMVGKSPQSVTPPPQTTVGKSPQSVTPPPQTMVGKSPQSVTPPQTMVGKGPQSVTPQATVSKGFQASRLPPAFAGKSFKDRVEIVRPLAVHPPVSEETIATVKDAISRLPSNIYKILDQGGCVVHVTCNLDDKWPDARTTTKRGFENETMATDPGHTYGHDVWVCERAVDRYTDIAKEPYPQFEIRCTFLHELGHALDEILGNYSTSAELKKIYDEDVKEIPAASRQKLSYFLQPDGHGLQECSGEIVAILLGSGTAWTDDFKMHFPRTMEWVRRKLEL